MKNMDKSGLFLFLEFKRCKPIFNIILKSGNSGLPAASGTLIRDKICGKKGAC
jgi:hypothetical protein